MKTDFSIWPKVVKKIYTSLSYSILSSYSRQLLSLISVMLIARMLAPSELGVFAIAASILLITSQFKSIGVGNYIIREKHIDRLLVKQSLGLTLLISWGAGTSLLFFAPHIEQYYEKKDIALLIQILSISFFLIPHIAIGKSLLTREFEFKKILAIDLTHDIVQFASVIIFILAGYSYFSLAYAAAIGVFAELVVTIILRNRLFSFTPKFTGTLKIAKFGTYLTLSNILTQTTAVLPDLIIGKLGTSAEVAFYSRGAGFLRFISMTISGGIKPIIAPYFSEKNREDKGDLNASFLRASSLIWGVSIPPLAIAGYASKPIIEVFFGSQWGQSAQLVSFMCFGAILGNLHSFSPLLLITLGLERMLFWRNLLNFLLTASTIYLLYPYGLKNITMGLVCVAGINFMFFSCLLQNFCGIRIPAFLKEILPTAMLTVACIFWAIFLDIFINFDTANAFVTVGLLAPSTAIIWLISIFLVKHPLREELNIAFNRITNKTTSCK